MIEYYSSEENKISFTVPDNITNINVKTFLRKNCNLSARTLSKLKRTDKGITLNGNLIKTTDTLHANDVVVISLPLDSNDILPVSGELNILYEDDHILVLDKPSGMPVHPTKIHQTDTLANLVSYYMKTKSENYTFRAINRLDRDTSGCVLIAKDRYSAAVLPDSVYKEYIAVAEGCITSSDTVDQPIKVMPGRSIQRMVSPDGVRCVTHYYPLLYKDGHTLLKFVLETGRTHQIRCHMSYIGHPLSGDDMYKGSLERITRQALHCYKIGFVHPITKQPSEYISQLPDDICSAIGIDGNFTI